jgi:hypothetical protein
MVQVYTNWWFRGLRVARVMNEFICVDVLPELGAKIYNFTHRPSDTNLLWHNPRIAPSVQPFGADFDNVWSGGWDELIPNDIPARTIDGDMLPDHGEIWSQPSEWQVVGSEDSSATLRFTNYGHVLPTVFEKTITLREGEPFFTIKYQLTNLGTKRIDFLWNVHPALRICSSTRLDVPARRGLVDSWRTEQFEANSEYEWPYAVDRAGNKIDLRKVPPSDAGLADQHYFPNISQGWYAVTDTEKQVGFGLVFPKEVFPHLWLFRTIGGWRGLYTLILEASNGYSRDIEVARQTGHLGVLESKGTVTAEVKAVAYSGFTAVELINQDGTIVAGK